MVKEEINFLFKVGRNALILSGLYFISVWGVNAEMTLETTKPIILFLGTYILTECAKRYGLDYKANKFKSNTLFL
jgi:hypothetical protein